VSFLLKDAIVYTRKKIAKLELGRISQLPTGVEDNLEISLAEEWLLTYFERYEIWQAKHPNHDLRKVKQPGSHKFRKLLGIAQCLGHFPVPDWWHVRQRMLKITYKDIEMFLDEDNCLKFEEINTADWTNFRPNFPARIGVDYGKIELKAFLENNPITFQGS